jgi:hypothetical protein
MDESQQEERRDPKNVAQRLALDAILLERDYQRGRWSNDHDRTHTPADWFTILTVWVGKLALETPLFQGGVFDKKKFMKRLAQLGAITAAAYEALSEDEAASAPPQETT